MSVCGQPVAARPAGPASCLDLERTADAMLLSMSSICPPSRSAEPSGFSPGTLRYYGRISLLDGIDRSPSTLLAPFAIIQSTNALGPRAAGGI
jgi:hypothetical protein